MTVLERAFYYLGLLTASQCLVRGLNFIFLFIRPSSLPRYRHDNNSWALVTGATGDIGFGFAQELCRRGFNVIIHGRNTAKLEKSKVDLEREHPDRFIRIAVADAFGSNVATAIAQIVLSVQDVKLTVLINNIGGVGGVLKPEFKTLESHTAEQVDGVIDLNDTFMTQLTRALLPNLSKNQPSLVINIGSMSSLMSMPYLTVYSASKAYTMAFSRNVEAEMKAEGKDVEVLGILLGNVKTEKRPDLTVGFGVPTARTMASATLERVGCGRSVVPGYLPHALQKMMLDCMPDSLSSYVMRSMMKQLKAEAEARAKKE